MFLFQISVGFCESRVKGSDKNIDLSHIRHSQEKRQIEQ